MLKAKLHPQSGVFYYFNLQVNKTQVNNLPVSGTPVYQQSTNQKETKVSENQPQSDSENETEAKCEHQFIPKGSKHLTYLQCKICGKTKNALSFENDEGFTVDIPSHVRKRRSH